MSDNKITIIKFWCLLQVNSKWYSIP